MYVAGLLYAIGGFDGVSPLKSVEQYNPLTDQWTSLPSMTTKRFGLGACACEGQSSKLCNYVYERSSLRGNSTEGHRQPVPKWSFQPVLAGHLSITAFLALAAVDRFY